MRGTKKENCKKIKKINTPINPYCKYQIPYKMGSGGALDPVAAIKMIEMTAKGNLEKMQSGFGVYDECKPDRNNTLTSNSTAFNIN